jgi:hypothetical protein
MESGSARDFHSDPCQSGAWRSSVSIPVLAVQVIDVSSNDEACEADHDEARAARACFFVFKRVQYR